MTITYFAASGYTALPWKNGLGTTDEVFLLPEGSTRDLFGVRVSRATIAKPGRFSAFQGVERVITLIAGSALDLVFGDTIQQLQPRRPYRFDSAKMPVGDPKGGVVRVLNVMAARAVWRISRAEVLEGAATLGYPQCVLFAISGDWEVADGGAEILLRVGDTALVQGSAQLAPTSATPGAVLVIGMEPVGAGR